MLKLYNTLSKQLEEFQPINSQHITMYVCGPTIYDAIHIGNARSLIVFDTLFRILKDIYPRVTFVRNITDIDDKIISAAKAQNLTITALTNKAIKIFHNNCQALNLLLPTYEPLATAYVTSMQTLITKLITKNYAYVNKQHVYFSVESFKAYGNLSNFSTQELIEGARVEISSHKQNPQDFILWKPSNKDEPGWISPWGFGRPGWHIECSAMAYELLGTEFDIHGGGLDLIFPHHENEIAQSCCAFDTNKMANYFLHNGFVMVNGQKMSKSLGNFITLNQLLEENHGEIIRLSCLLTHYQQPLNFQESSLNQAKNILDKFYQTLNHVAILPIVKTSLCPEFTAALLNNLNTPMAITILQEKLTLLNKAITKKEQQILKSALLKCANLLGILQIDPKIYLQTLPNTAKSKLSIDTKAIETLILKRNTARLNKNFSEADKIRTDLETLGIIIEDTLNTTTWRINK